MKNATVHRFHNAAAISLPGKGETVYLTEKEARQIARALYACARSIRAEKFIESSFGTVSIGPLTGKDRAI